MRTRIKRIPVDVDAVPILEPRPYIMKCAGAGLSSCSTCTRFRAQVAEERQRWIEPTIADGVCRYAAAVEVYAPFYQPLSPEVAALVVSSETAGKGTGTT